MKNGRLIEAYETEDGATLFVLADWKLPDDLPLTAAERDVATRLLEGASNGAIAKARGVSLPTVAKQVSSIYQKLGARSRAELVTLLLREDRRPPREAPPVVRPRTKA